MDETTATNNSKKCVLKCTQPAELFAFPSENIIRKLWLYKLGLTTCDTDTQICELHFSQSDHSKIAIPDQNLPENIERNENYEKLIKKIMDIKIIAKNDVNPHPKRKDVNESSSKVIDGTQSEAARVEEELISTILNDDPVSAGVSNKEAKSGLIWTIGEEDEDLLSKYIRLAGGESPSAVIDGSEEGINKTQKLIRNEQPTSDDMGTDQSESIDIDGEDINESRELTQKEFDMIIEEDPQTDEALPSATEPQAAVPPSKPLSPPKTFENLIDDPSTLLLDYQLRIQGKYMCDVIEIPEYIAVLTIPKAKEPLPAIVPSKYNLKKKSKMNVRSILDIPPSISVSRTLDDEPKSDDVIEQIDYVYYMGEDGNPRRDREVQVDIEIKTKDSANQCDVELDVNMAPIRCELKSRNSAEDFKKRECLICGEILPNYFSQVKHFALHENNLPCLCSYCGATFENQQKLKTHEKYFHDGVILEFKEAIRCPKLFCHESFHSKKQLYSHIDEHIANTGYKCFICSRVFNSSVQVFRHQKMSKICLKRKKFKQNAFFRRKLENAC